MTNNRPDGVQLKLQNLYDEALSTVAFTVYIRNGARRRRRSALAWAYREMRCVGIDLMPPLPPACSIVNNTARTVPNAVLNTSFMVGALQLAPRRPPLLHPGGGCARQLLTHCTPLLSFSARRRARA
jgi:hypothetical protein